MERIDRCLVIIPCYNEVENIRQIIAGVLGTNKDLHLLIIDDNSPDGTGKTADELAHEDPRISVLHRPQKLGLASAYIAGFKYAIEKGYDIFFEMDADFSHDPMYLPRFLTEIKSCDVVIGSRYIQGVNVVNWPMSRLLLSYGANMYARMITGMPLRDSTSGFKCFRRRVLENIDFSRITSEGYAFQIEVNFLCWKKGFKLCEIPIVFVDRRAGKSKISRKIIVEAMWVVWKLRLQTMFI